MGNCNIKISHETRYQYDSPVELARHLLFVHPRSDSIVKVNSLRLTTNPEVGVRWARDPFENVYAILDFSKMTHQLRLSIETSITLGRSNPFDFILESHAVNYPFPYNGYEKMALAGYFKAGVEPDASEVLTWIYSLLPVMPNETMDILLRLNRGIFETFNYSRREEEGIQSPNETLNLGSGSCRDFSWLFLHACWQMGFPARFVSGYLIPLAAGDSLSDRAEGAMHAWVEVYLPGAGWKGFDPTNGILSTEAFVPCAVSIEPDRVSPIQGSFYGPGIGSSMQVDLKFSPESED